MFPYGILIIIIGIGFLRWMQMFPYGILIIIIGIGIGIAAVITGKKNRSLARLILGVGGASLLLLFSFLIPLEFAIWDCDPSYCHNINYIPFLIFGIIAVIGIVIGVKFKKLGLYLNILLGIIVLVYGLYTIFTLGMQNAWEGALLPDYPEELLFVPIIASVFLLAQGVSSYMALKKESRKTI